jgi:hypothetical protein
VCALQEDLTRLGIPFHLADLRHARDDAAGERLGAGRHSPL